MTKQRWAALGALLVAGTALGGCMTGPRSLNYAYYAVPCGTPGAIEARPLADEPTDNGDAMPPLDGDVVPQAPADPGPTQGATRPTCVVPVVAGSGYRGTRYPYGRGYYGAPFYGSVGFGFYGGSGFGRSHGGLSHGFSHRGSAHHGRRH